MGPRSGAPSRAAAAARCSTSIATATRSTNPIRDLQAAHAAHPWIVTWDDHEVDQRLHRRHLARTIPIPARFLEQRAAAYQAYLGAHAAAALRCGPRGPSLRLYDRYRFGDLAELHVLDDRQYRSHHACRATLDPRQAAGRTAPSGSIPTRTMLGAEQEAWFADGMRRASARWNLIAQQTLMAELDRGQDERTLLGRRLGRLSGGAPAPARCGRGLAGARHAGAGRRRPFLLGRRPQAATSRDPRRRPSRPSSSAARSPRRARRPERVHGSSPATRTSVRPRAA